MTTPFVGEIQLFGFNFAPVNWAFCNGALLSISQNPALFSLIGTTYGGNGTTTFALPNLQEHVPCGQGRGPGLSQRAVGQSFGESEVTLLETNLPRHTHSMTGYIDTDQSKRGSAPANGNGLTFPFAAEVFVDNAAADSQFSPNSIGRAGGSLPHENEQPYLALNFCIALDGVFPSFS